MVGGMGTSQGQERGEHQAKKMATKAKTRVILRSPTSSIYAAALLDSQNLMLTNSQIPHSPRQGAGEGGPASHLPPWEAKS